MSDAKALPEPLQQAREFVGGLTVKQRLALGGGAVLVALVLWGFVWLIGNPKYTPLFSGLRPSEAQALGSRLAAKNIPYEISSDGSSLLVPAEKLDAARLETASQGLPRNARLGFELFDTPNWAGSNFTEQVNYQRALEGELERTLQALNEVEAVRVHLVMPRDSLFTEQAREAKAAVIVKMRGGRLSEQAQAAIPQLVASAVDTLRPDKVTVIDADSNTPLLRLPGPGGGATFGLDDDLSKTLMRTLEPVVGADHVRASVHVEYDLSTSENTEETYDPKAVAAVSQQRSEELMGAASPGGVPGTASNLPGNSPAAAVTAKAQDTQSSRSESSTYVVSKSIRHRVDPAGRLKRIAAAVLVDDVIETRAEAGKQTTTRRKRTPAELNDIEQLARAAIGFDASRGDLLAVENLSFQESPVEAVATPTRLERSRRVVAEWSGALRYLGIAALFLIVYGLLLRPIKKQALDAFRQLPSRLARGSRENGGAEAGVAPGARTLDAGNLPNKAEEARRAEALKRQLAEKIKAEPGAASRLVESWVRQAETR